MRVDVVGGGPAGLYSAILLKKSYPDARISVVERNRPDDTFGFGIVLSDETLGRLARTDEKSHQRIAANFAYWDDIYVQYKGQVLKSSGHGFSGLERLALLRILQKRAQSLGIEIAYETEDKGVGAHQGADLIIAADGINSAIRNAYESHFKPDVDLRTNRFVWLGARMNLPGFYYSFREHRGHIWNMHAYQYKAGHSTIVIETTDDAFLDSGLAIDDEQGTAELVERIFADDLQGAKVLTNRSHWRQFPSIDCATWCHEVDGSQIVLLGDAAHTAHWSIGSGTKLALEDAIALHEAIVAQAQEHGGDPLADLAGAMARYEAERHEEAGRIRHSANVSLVWFENVRRFWQMDPVQFNISLLTRSKQITYENLRMRDPVLVGEVTRWWNRQQAQALGLRADDGHGGPAPWLDAPPIFAPFRLREAWLQNRIVVSPMAQYSAVEGVPTDWHLVHYGSRALGGAGLVFMEMTCPSEDARITPGCTGLWNREQMLAFKRIVDFVHGQTETKLCMQLGHAGRKGSTQLGWERMDHPLEKKAANWPLVSASAIPYRKGVNQVPREMARDDMDRVIAEFVHSARLADEAGFDMLELHMAHGYLLASFLSPITNHRKDDYGGDVVKRMRFPLELFEAVRATWPQAKPLSVRLSATDWITGGQSGADSVEVARALRALGCDLIDVSTGQTDPASRPLYGRMYQAAFAEQIRLETGLPTMAVGAITSADQANTLLVSGRADLVALARPHLANPYFTLHAAADYDYRGQSWPVQYETGAAQMYTLAQRAKEDLARKLEAAAQGRGAGA
ncbi:MAG: FAD-dependent monooxygenase [Burkholderiaceae bacterium]